MRLDPARVWQGYLCDFGSTIMAGGGLAGHNGLRSLIDVLKTKSFARLKVGVGRPAEGVPVHVHVLTPFDQVRRCGVRTCA